MVQEKIHDRFHTINLCVSDLVTGEQAHLVVVKGNEVGAGMKVDPSSWSVDFLCLSE